MCGRGKLRWLVLLAAVAAVAATFAPASGPQGMEAQGALEPQAESADQFPNLRNDRRLGRGDLAPTFTQKQLDGIVRSNLAKSKKDAEELATLARQLHEELGKPNANAFSPDDKYRLEKIEKLAKKIRDQMKGY